MPTKDRFDDLDLREEPPRQAKLDGADAYTLQDCTLHSRYKTCTC